MLGPRQLDALSALGLDPVRASAPLGPLTRLGIGGPADALVEVPDPTVLAQLARWCRRDRVPLTPLQRGTDALVRDAGIRGVVFLLGEHWRAVRHRPDGLWVGGEAAVADLDFDELPPWLRSGGTVANALTCRGKGHGGAGLLGVDVVLGKGVTRSHGLDELDPSSARLGLRDEAVVAGVLLGLGGTDERDLVAPPPGVPLFRDPQGASRAADLLGRSGLLGVRVRGARIDDIDPGQLLTEDGATAHDVELLIDWAQRKVAADWGVELTPAIRILGARR